MKMRNVLFTSVAACVLDHDKKKILQQTVQIWKNSYFEFAPLKKIFREMLEK